jgi:hypothetical protein
VTSLTRSVRGAFDKLCGAKCKPYIQLLQSLRRAQLAPRSLIRFTHQPAAQAKPRLPVASPAAIASLLIHPLGPARLKQHVGVSYLRGPVAGVDAHVDVYESGGIDCLRARGSWGSRLTWRALGGIALRFATFLSRRHP